MTIPHFATPNRRPSGLWLSVITAALAAGTASAQIVFTPVQNVPSLDLFQPVTTAPAQLGSFNIVLNPTPALSGNAPALAAFQRAADLWESYFSDPITVTIDADLALLGPGIIGSAGSVLLQGSYSTIRDQMVADAADEAGNGIVAALPTAAQFTALLPGGFSYNGFIVATKANLKAMGFLDLDGIFGVSDAEITFSSAFSFDYDNSDGVGAGLVDFETVAAHEIGHALGFISWVDQIAGFDPEPTFLNPLDLFRFDSTAGNNPTDLATFTSKPRDLRPGGTPIFDDLDNEYSFSTGLVGGDGRQASHWKDDSLTGTLIGVMDPTLPNGLIEPITFADVRAFDVIGYELAVPEPSTYAAIVGLGVIGLLQWRRSRRAA